MNIPHFRGVFMRDEFANLKPYTYESGIVNLDDSSGPGTHWTAYKKVGSRVFWFDSFGDLQPPKEIIKYFTKCSIHYNLNSFQQYNTYNCGHLCLQFLSAHK